MLVSDILKLVPSQQYVIIEDVKTTKWLHNGLNKNTPLEAMKKEVVCAVAFNTTLILQIA